MNDKAKQLCALIQKEQDSDKLVKLVEQFIAELALDGKRIQKVYVVESKENAS